MNAAAQIATPEALAAPQTRDERVLACRGMVKQMALRMAGRLPSSVDLDDLMGAGMMGLMDAAERFDASRAIPFEAYARTRIHGAILDALRAEDHLTRRERRLGRAADRAEDQLRSRSKQEPSADQIHKARRGVPRSLPHAMAFVPVEDVDDGSLESAFCDPFTATCSAEAHGRLKQAVAALEARDQTILSLYYEQDLTYREIGQVLGVTESRICQLLRQLHGKLKSALSELDS